MFTRAVSQDTARVRAILKLLSKPIERQYWPDFNYGKFKPENQFQANGSSNGQRHNSGPQLLVKWTVLLIRQKSTGGRQQKE
jgi:hypothetical protein